MKNLLFTLLLFTVANSLNAPVLPVTFYRDSIIYGDSLTANDSAVITWAAKLNDSLDIKWIRFFDLNNHDSTIKYLAVDTIRSKPNIDTILGRPYIDSLRSKKIIVTDSVVSHVGIFTEMR